LGDRSGHHLGIDIKLFDTRTGVCKLAIVELYLRSERRYGRGGKEDSERREYVENLGRG
jgi:hypothetical protein